jgi:tetratricopeptide (TPR) repeat protein
MAKKKSRKSNRESEALETSFDNALKAAESDPGNRNAWDHLEEIAEQLQRPEDVAQLYRTVLSKTLESDTRDEVAQRAVGFHEEWLGDDLDGLVALLDRIFEMDPQADWAFERMVMELTDARRWDELMSFYDKALAVIKDTARRRQLLDDAAHVAKDFADRPDRALDYMGKLLAIDPDNAQLVSQLERLYERQERWSDLVELWRRRIPTAKANEVPEIRTSIAAAYLDKVGDPARALEEIRTIIDISPGHEGGLALLERILAMDEAPTSVRLGALALLRTSYDSLQREDDSIRVLSSAIEFTGGEEQVKLRKEAGRMLANMERWEESISHFAVLVKERPADLDARRNLFRVAKISNRNDLLADALMEAAESCEDDIVQVHLLTEAAYLYRNELGVAETAIDLFTRVLNNAAADQRVKLNSAHVLNDLLAEEERPRDRMQVLDQLAVLEQAESLRKAIVGEAARLAEEIGEKELAIEKWSARLEKDRGDLEALDALIDLYEQTERWQEMADALAARAGADIRSQQRRSDLIRRASLQGEKLDDPAGAIETLLTVREEFGEDPDLLQTLDALLSAQGRWADLADTFRPAALDAHDWACRILERLGDVHRENLEQPEKALEYYTAALADNPASEVARTGLKAVLPVPACARGAAEALSRAYEITDDWEATIELLEPHIEATDDAEGKVRILVRTARLCEERAEDPERALELVSRAMALAPYDVALESTLRRLARQTRRWEVAAQAYGAAADALEEAPEREAQLRYELARILENELGDESAALAQLKTAHGLDPTRTDLKRDLTRVGAKLLRGTPGPDLVETLLVMDEMAAQDLDALHEAAQVALEHTDDDELKRTVLQKLYLRASRLMMARAETVGDRDAPESTVWALTRLVDLHLAHERESTAAQVLVEGTRLPLDEDIRRQWSARAADIYERREETAKALSLYSEMLTERPDDIDTVRKCAALCENDGRVTELMSYKLRELELTGDAQERLELRLSISELAEQFEKKGGRVEALLANLEERPGHRETVDELVSILEKRGQYDRLAETVTGQASLLEEAGETSRAAELWALVADIAERRLDDARRAIDAHGRVVELDCTSHALDALAHLHSTLGEHEVAAGWLEKRLEMATEREQVSVLLKLARERLDADMQDRAVEALERAFEEAPRNAEVRRMLIDVYRRTGSWEPLVQVLSTAAEHAKDRSAILAYASEVHDICTRRIGAPERAAGVLEKALELDPDDRALKRKLAEALLADEQHEKVKELVEDLIEEFGRRRSPERAALHLMLARVHGALGETAEAIGELELASKMDRSNAHVQATLAEMARESGDLDKAEHAYRTLLLTVRRRQDEEAEDLPIGPAEVYIELSRIAETRGERDKASELVESALEAIVQNDDEAPRLEANLREHEEFGILRRVLETRLGHVRTPRKHGRILSSLARLLEEDLEDREAALETRLAAMENDPVFPPHHEAARELALRLDRVETYVEKLESLLEQARRGTDVYVRCELLLRLGEVMQRDRKDYERAAELYDQAEATGVREVDVWRAQADLAGEMDDRETQMELLSKLASLGEDRADARAVALYSMAEVHLSSEETLEEGVETLRQALDEDPLWTRAGRIMRRASDLHGDDPEFMALYEKVARRCDDDGILLSYLEKHAESPEAEPEQLEEAVKLALEFGEVERAERLMHRAVEIGRDLGEEIHRVGWALLALAERRKEAGDLAGAVRWLSEASTAADPERLFSLGREIVEEASGPDGDLTLVARLYEAMLESHPASREVWEPLASIYAELGDVDRLDQLVEGTLDALPDVEERNALRMIHARASMEAGGEMEEVIESLRTILMEQPEHEEAQELLIGYFEKAGRVEDVMELLRNNLMVAQNHNDLDAIRSISMKLAGFYLDEDRAEAESIYRGALEWMPEDPELLEALMQVLPEDADPRDRAELMERILVTKEGDDAAESALSLAEIYHYLEDQDGVLRALETGFDGAPSNVQLLSRLEQAYAERGKHSALAEKLVQAADHRDDPDVKIDLLMKAARLYRETLEDPASASRVLERAAEISPDDPRVVMELCSAMRDAGERHQAIERLSHLLSTDPGDWRLEVLSMRADLNAALGDNEGAIEDLEAALAIDASVAPDLEKALNVQRMTASQDGDPEKERAATLRLVELEMMQDKTELARQLLAEWVHRTPEDVEVLRQLRDFDMREDNWAGVADTCSMLSRVEEGAAQIDAVLDMTRAFTELGRLEEAREQLEAVHEQHPDNPDVRATLMQVYEASGVKKELAALLHEQAGAVDEEDEKVALLTRAGEILVEAGETDEAASVLQDLLELRPGDIGITAALADAHLASGALDEAWRVIEESLQSAKRTPQLSTLLRRQSRIAGARDDHPSELSYLVEAFKLDRKNGELVAELADLSEKMGDFETAQQALRTVPLVTGECPISVVDSYLRQGRICLMTGDDKRALFCARKAQKEDPESEAVAAFLSELGEG